MTPKQQALEELMAVMERWGLYIESDGDCIVRVFDRNDDDIVSGCDIEPETLQAELNRMKDDG